MKDKIKLFELNEKPKEEKPNVKRKKLEINAFLKKMNEDNKKKEEFRRLSLKEELLFDEKIKDKLINLTTTKEKKKEEKIAPKKIDMNKQTELMRESLKSTKKGQDESLKNPPKKISMEDYLKKLNNSNKKYTFIKKKIPKKLDTEKILKDMIDNQNIKKENAEIDEDSFENVFIRNRSSTVSERIINIKSAELERKKKIEEDKRLIEEDRERIREERRKREEERKKREEERRKKEEEERIEREKREEEERKEREKREEEERKKREEDLIKYEQEKKEREKREEEERKKREEEEKKGKEEEARKRKEEEENLIKKGLQKINKKEKDLSEAELKRLLESERYEKSVEDYNKVTHRDYINNYEGIDIKFTFEEINQISTDSLNDIEVTKGGKILALSHKDVSKITIYSPKTYEEEDCIIFESKVNSMKIDDKYIYCALNENTENILIISMDNYYNKIYLSGHNCAVTDLAIYKYGNFVSADKNGTVIHWEDNKIKKVLNDIKGYINTICLIGTIVAILSFKLEMVKFYDLRYSCLECIETIRDIKGSGFKNNMLKLNPNILAISGTYIYIIDLNSLIVTNRIYCLYANDSISSFHFNKKGYFFVSQALTHLWNNDIEKGILGYYQYNFKSEIIPEYNSLIKLASKSKCHNNFISAIKQLDKKTIVTGSFDGKIKFWNLKEI